MAKSGLFVTFEGGEGAGKTTLITALASLVQAQGLDFVQTREPGGTKGAEDIRGLLVTGDADRWTSMAETLLFFAAREDHLARLIRPALAKGALVLCDRFSDSTRAYQGVSGKIGQDVVDALDTLVVADTQPDLTFILDLPVEAGLARAMARAQADKDAIAAIETRFEQKGLAYHQALRDAYLALAAQYPQRCHVIDAQQPPAAILAQAWAIIAQKWGLDG